MFYASARARIVPFWNRIPQFFLYPLRPEGLAVVITCLLLFAVLPMTLFGWLARAVVALFFIKYCFHVLADTSEGRLRPPALTGELLTEHYELPFKQFGVFVVLGVVNALLFQVLGNWAVLLFGLVTNLAYPASTMVLATSRSLRDAVNPRLVFGVMGRIGWAYLALLGMLLLLSGSTGAVFLLAEKVQPGTLAALAGASFMYFSVVMFHLMGYVVFQYHERLGYSASQAEAADEDPELALFRNFMAQENFDAALVELRDVVSRRRGEMDLHRLLHRLAKLTRDGRTLVRHGGDFIGLLLDQGKVREAMDVYRDIVAVEPQFRPEQPEQYLAIARMLRESRHARLALAMINGFHKRYPQSDQTPPLYFLAAQMFHDDLGDDRRARQILEFLQKAYPRHALSAKVDRYLQALDGFMGRSA